MKKILIVLMTALFALSANLSYAQLGVQAGSASMVALVTGDEPVVLENDIGITSYTMTDYLHNRPTEKRVIEIDEYERTEALEFLIRRMRIFTYIFDDSNEWIFVSLMVMENIFYDDCDRPISQTALTYAGSEESRANLVEAQEIRIVNNSIWWHRRELGRWAIPYEYSPLPERTQFVLAIFPNRRSTNEGEEIRITDVTVSDLATGEVIGFIPELASGQDNTVVLERLDQIQTELGKLDEIKEDVNRSNRLSRRIYRYVRRIYFLIRRLLGFRPLRAGN